MKGIENARLLRYTSPIHAHSDGGSCALLMASKKSVNVSLAPEILEEARRLKLNLSAVLTAALQERFRAH